MTSRQVALHRQTLAETSGGERPRTLCKGMVYKRRRWWTPSYNIAADCHVSDLGSLFLFSLCFCNQNIRRSTWDPRRKLPSSSSWATSTWPTHFPLSSLFLFFVSLPESWLLNLQPKPSISTELRAKTIPACRTTGMPEPLRWLRVPLERAAKASINASGRSRARASRRGSLISSQV